jgi:type IV pilus assembly protein PilW
MRKKIRLNQNGITLIELLVAFVICAIVVAGTYRVFVAQTKAYTVQDQVVEVQQNIRTAMEILLRDLRMAGYDSDSLSSKISIANPILVNGDHEVTVNYEYDDTNQYGVRYFLENGNLRRELTVSPFGGAPTSTTDTLLENVDALDFTYGVDTNDDGAMDGNWVSAAGIGTAKVVAVRVILTAKPDQTNPDVRKVVSPRTLTSAVTLRNQCLR